MNIKMEYEIKKGLTVKINSVGLNIISVSGVNHIGEPKQIDFHIADWPNIKHIIDKMIRASSDMDKSPLSINQTGT